MGESERRHRDSESHRHRERDDEYYSKRKSEKEGNFKVFFGVFLGAILKAFQCYFA